MEAKDTVMSDERFIEIFTEEQKRQGVPDKYNFPEAIAGNVHYHRMLAQAQAEISFKAGIKEVVETELNLVMAGGKFKIKELFSLRPEGQAKLKEWGVDWEVKDERV